MAMELAMAKAATYGMGIVAVRNSNHFGGVRQLLDDGSRARDDRARLHQLAFVAMAPTFGRKP
jgi:LDH2 family malate/lactate/ureidoglycolate dehydrogenase